MPLNRPSARVRRLAAGATVAAVAVAGLLWLPGTAQAAAPQATAVLGAQPQYSGVVRAWPGDADKDPAHAVDTRDGVGCWTTSGDPYNRYLYVDVDPAARPSGAKRAIVTVDYTDTAPTSMDVQYDGTAGAFTGSNSVTLQGSGAWKSAQFVLGDINFADRSNGADFRINVKAGADAIPRICFARVEVAFTDLPLLDITSPSLLFEQGRTDKVAFKTAASTVGYVIADSAGVPVKSGSVPADASGNASLDVTSFGPGYYTLAATADSGAPVTRSTSFGVVAPLPAGVVDPDSFFSVAVHYGWQPAGSEQPLLDSLARVGFGSVRADVNWSGVEKTKGVYDFGAYPFEAGAAYAKGLGISSMPIGGYRNPLYDGGKTPSTPDGLAAYAAYAAATSKHYDDQGVGDEISIFNEYNSTGFNNGACGITPECYLAVLNASYPAIHAANPNAKVVGPTTAGTSLPWNQKLIDLGGLSELDTFSTNFYGYGNGTLPEQTVLTTELPTLVGMVDAADGDRNLPFWATENGCSTATAFCTETQQADYAIRAPLLAMAAGVDKYFWYDALDDGLSPDEREHNFGLFRRPTTGIASVAPKSSAVSYAVMIRQIWDKKQQPRENLGPDTAYSYPFTGGSGRIRSLWATSPTTATVTATGPVTVTDQFGRKSTLTPQAGVVRLALDASPVFLAGPVTKVTAGASPLSLAAPERSVTGATIPVTVTADRTEGARLPGWVKVDVAGESAWLRTERGRETSVTVDVPATTALGERELTATVATFDGTFARLQDATAVAMPLTASGRPKTAVNGDGQPGGFAYSLDLTVTNNDPANAATASRLSWRMGGLSGVVDEAVRVEPGATATVNVPLSGVAPFQSYDSTVYAFADTATAGGSAPVSWSPIEPEGSASLDAIGLDAMGVWASIGGGTRTGGADLGGALRFTHTPDALVTTAVIADETHNANRTDPALAWQVDSIQYDVYTGFPADGGASRVEITAALLPSGPVAYTHAAPPGGAVGPTPGAEVAVVRDEAAKTTTYTLSVPWSSLGFSSAPASVFGLSFLVNDADARTGGDARDGYMEWGSGVGSAPKNPAKFRSAQLVGPVATP